MATVSVSSVGTSTAMFNVEGLQYEVGEYDYFSFNFYQNGTLIMNMDLETNKSSTNNFFYTVFDGVDWFTPYTTYELAVNAMFDGSYYYIGTVLFTTKSIAPPSGTISPTLYTKVKYQVYETCVPMSLSTAMDIFRAKKIGTDYENFSVSYIFGDGGGYSWGMYFEETVINCCSHGSPRWDLVSTSFEADDKNINDSEYVYNNANSYVRDNAKLQAFSGYESISFYDCPAVANAISTYGYFMFNFRIPNNFYSINSTGIVPQPNSYSGANHSISLIGLTTKNGKPHWIAQNSWGTGWGASGICYIPYDWGIGVMSPIRGGADITTWSLESFSVWNSTVSSIVPAESTNVVAVKNGDLSALVSWDSSLSGALYTVFASKMGMTEWYIKGRTTAKSLTITFDNYATYEIRVLSSLNDIYSDYSNIFNVAMLNLLPWDWHSPKATGIGFNITRTEWLAFCNKINEVRVAKGLSSYSFTTSSTYISKDKPFYAWIWLQCANAINDLGTGVSSACLNVKSGDDIYAWYFDNLKTALNNAIPL